MKNLLRVAFYRFQVRSGRLRSKLPIGQPIVGSFFRGDNPSIPDSSECPGDASLLLQGQLRYFSHQLFPVSNPPDWFLHPETGASFPNIDHWSMIGDFGHGDIKLIWEPSRFHWVILAAQGYATTKDLSYLTLINQWLMDWSEKNPVNQGSNWKCGQETSIRLMNLLLAAFIFGEYRNPTHALVQMVIEHCQRIYPTLHYAVAQDNNHGTSEVAALFIAGVWLEMVGEASSESKLWMRRGYSGLEERVNHLVAGDGSFSQHSVNYHRLLLDTVALAEFWRLQCKKPSFSKNYYQKVIAATHWLSQMTDPVTGDAPNLGANDGAYLLQLESSDYRDFRPSVQLASALFRKSRVYGEGCDELLRWLGIKAENLPVADEQRVSNLFRDGGYVSLVGDCCSGVLRFPRFRFRPSHVDLMHLDIMDRGIPIVRDGGTFSYNTDSIWLNYFPGIESHNTIQFDGSEPMPRLSRFLFGDWPEIDLLEWNNNEAETLWSGGYRDYLGRTHHRTIRLEGRVWLIEDHVSGFIERAVLRWRLIPADWKIKENMVVSDKATIMIETNEVEIERMELVEGWESRHYNEKTSLPVLEVEIKKPGVFRTIIELPKIERTH